MPLAKLFPAALIAALTLTVAFAAPPVPKAKPADYFPTAVGTKWVYRLDKGDEFTKEVTQAETKDGETRLSLRRSYTVGPGVENEFTVTATEVVQRTINGGAFKGFDQLLLKLPLAADATWEFDAKPQKFLRAQGGTRTVGKAVKVKVPAGEFECLPVETKVTRINGKDADGETGNTSYYAVGVGLVKCEAPAGGFELVEFTPGKAK